ncbi:MAG: hypothetical protein AAGG72_01825 [Pseudomonadota bacterium]
MTERQIARAAGACLTVISAYLTLQFGMHWSYGIAVGLVAISIASDVLPTLIARSRELTTVERAAGMICATVFLAVNLMTNVGAVTWRQTADIAKAQVSQTTYAQQQDTIADHRDTLRTLKAQLAKLQTAWPTQVSATGLRARIATLDEAIRQEAGRGGCGPKCLDLKDQHARVSEQVGAIERSDNLQKRIAATQRAIETFRAKPVQYAVSGAAAQNTSLAALFTLSLKPTADAQNWAQKWIGVVMAIAFAFGALGLNFFANRPDRASASRMIDPLKAAMNAVDNSVTGGRQTTVGAYVTERLKLANVDV